MMFDSQLQDDLRIYQKEGRLTFYRQWDLYRDRIASERAEEIKCPYAKMSNERAAWLDGWNKGCREVDNENLRRTS
jgi:ribosome modulation factor